MDSPERNPIAAASSPAVQEPFFSNFLSNLSPIKPVETVRFTQMWLDANFPPPPPVFTSPQIDMQRKPNFLKRDETNDAGLDVYRQFKTVLDDGTIPCSEKEVQSSSPSWHDNDYLADPMEGDDCMNSAELHSRKADDAYQALQSDFSGSKEMVTKFINGTHEKKAEFGSSISLESLDQADKDRPRNALELVQHASNQRDAERFDEFLQFMSEKVVGLASDAQHSEQIVAQEVTQNHRETRRHLQFERAVNYSSSTARNTSSQHATTNTENSRLPAGLSRYKSSASHMESGRTSSIQQPVSYSQTTSSQQSLCLAKRPDTYTVNVRSIQKDGNANRFGPMRSRTGLHLNSIGKASPMISDASTGMELDGHLSTQENSGIQNLAKKQNSIAREISYAEDGDQETEGVEAAPSAAFRSTNTMNPPNASHNLRLFMQHSSPFTGGMSDSESAGRNKELNQVSPNQKRRRGPNTSDSEGCKHCNCKRSKCLKLYCDCFAAGVYCADSCACENCFNKPEYEDTVLDSRQQIESRNPLAFAPKIVKLGTDSPAIVMDDGNRATPSSARHKRGCNCKKSLCLKKYCECYQSKVGCSDGCRCEGCKNSFGSKAETMYRKTGRWEGPSQEKLETTDIGHASVDKLRSCYLSPESVSLDQVWNGSKSPIWEGLADFSRLTPLSHPYPRTVASLDASSSRDLPEVSQTRLHQGNNFQSSTGSLHWCNSSISLMPQPSGSKAARKLSSDSALYDLVKNDDTTEILKDTTTPTKAVIVYSPKKKRVSSPHFRLQGLRSSSSPGLTSARKFILQGVSSFPPLTPYSNLKNDANQYRSYPKGSSSDQ